MAENELHIEQATIGKKADGLYAEINFTRLTPGAGITATTYIEAPRRGDEAMQQVAEAIQAKAEELGQPITHITTPTNKGAEALMKRTPGYQKRKQERGSPVRQFERTFTPLPPQIK